MARYKLATKNCLVWHPDMALTNWMGWGPEGFDLDKTIDPPSRLAALAAVHFALDGDGMEEFEATARKFLPILRDGSGYHAATPEEMADLEAILIEFYDYESNQEPCGPIPTVSDSAITGEQWDRWIFCIKVAAATFTETNLPLE